MAWITEPCQIEGRWKMMATSVGERPPETNKAAYQWSKAVGLKVTRKVPQGGTTAESLARAVTPPSRRGAKGSLTGKGSLQCSHEKSGGLVVRSFRVIAHILQKYAY